MGDADSTQIVMSAAEIERWMDDALNEMDEGLNILFSFMNLLNQRTVQMMSELMAWHRFRRCFAALSLFAVPTLLAIGIVYGTSQVLEHSMYGNEAGLQSVVAFLMFLSWSVGFPFYVFSVWQTYFAKNELEQVSTQSGVWNQEKSNADESNLALPLVEESLLDIGKMINKRMRDGIRQELERRINEAVEVQAVIDLTPSSSDASDNFYEGIIDKNEVPETGVADLPEVGGTLSNVACAEMFQKEQKPETCGVKVFILNASQDLSVEIQKEAPEDDVQEPPCDLGLKMLVDEVTSVQTTPRGVRSIHVENVGEGDYRNCSKKNEDLMQFVDKDPWDGN